MTERVSEVHLRPFTGHILEEGVIVCAFTFDALRCNAPNCKKERYRGNEGLVTDHLVRKIVASKTSH